MRKITFSQILYFQLLLWSAISGGILTTWLLLADIPLGDFRGIALSLCAITLIYLYAFLVYRIFLHFRPLQEGFLAQGSSEEFTAQVHALFYLLIFNSLIRTHFLPIPLMRLVYIALGAKLGKNTYSAGAILDPPLTHVGDNTIIGHDAALFSHAIEGDFFALNSIHIGNNVTIGATAVIMPDVIIGDGAIVSAGAVVSKGSRIGPGEVWGGLPAKLLKKKSESDKPIQTNKRHQTD